MLEGRLWIVFSLLVSNLSRILTLDNAAGDKAVSTATPTLPQQSSQSPSPVQPAKFVAAKQSSAQVQQRTGQQPPALPTMSSGQQQGSLETRPQTAFRHLQPRPGQNSLRLEQNHQPAASASPETNTALVGRPSITAMSATKARQTSTRQEPNEARQLIPKMRNRVKSARPLPPQLAAAPAIPAQPIPSLNRASLETGITAVQNASRTGRRRKFPHPMHRTRAASRRLRLRVADTNLAWPAGDYCIMPGSSGTCPAGFAAGSVGFAVPISVKNDKMYRDGTTFKRYIELGKIGGFDIGSENFDQIYRVSLTACCRVKAG